MFSLKTDIVFPFINIFLRCGVWPVDRGQYPTKRLNTILHRRYKTWVEGAKQPLSAEELDEIFKESEEQLQEENEKTNDHVNNPENSGENFPVVYKGNSMDTKALVNQRLSRNKKLK